MGSHVSAPRKSTRSSPSKTAEDTPDPPHHATQHPRDKAKRTHSTIPGLVPAIIVSSDPTPASSSPPTRPGSMAPSLSDERRSTDALSFPSSHFTLLPRNRSTTSLLSNRSSLPMSVRAESFVASLVNIRPEASKPDRPNGRAKMTVSIDFGTVLSGVACGISSGQVKQIMWPRGRRKLPSCLVYDAKGDMAAWGPDALTKHLKKGWVRCEMFKLWFDPTVPLMGILGPLPEGKQPVDVVTDYLEQLWKHAVPRILKAGYTTDMLQSADIWISVPAVWNQNGTDMMREAVSRSGMATHLTHVDGGNDRLHIITEPEAAAVHCAISNNLHLTPPQSFMVCDAGGGTIDVAIYRILSDIGTLQIAERCTCSGASCGSHFLDVRFRAYLEQWHAQRNIPLRAENLHRFLRTFREGEKIAFDGTQRLLFDCFNSHDYDNFHLPTSFQGGQFVVEADVVREEIFDPVVSEVIELLEHQLGRVGSVDALMLVGGFSGSPYLFRCIDERFRSRIKHIVRPVDGDIATSLGAAQCGIAQSSAQRPLVANAIIAPKSYIASVELPSAPESREGVAHRNPPQVRDPSALYIMVKGAVWKKKQPLMETMTKVSSSPSDSVFVAKFYCSDSDVVQSSTNGLVHLRDWSIDLGIVPSIKDRLNASPSGGCRIVFELGMEVDGAEIYALWRYREVNGVVKGARIRLERLY